MHAIEERVCDRHVLKLLRALLRAGVMQDGTVRRAVAGTPQGGVISPLLANVYLDRLDRTWQTRAAGVLVRYADDLVVMCRTKREAERALGALRSILAELGLEPKEAKTRIVHLREGGEGMDFLGFEHRWVRGREARHRHHAFLARWPSRRAMQNARDRLRQLTGRERPAAFGRAGHAGDQRVPARLGGLFRYGNSARPFDQITRHAFERLAIFVAKRRGGTPEVVRFRRFPDERALQLARSRPRTAAIVSSRREDAPRIRSRVVTVGSDALRARSRAA